MGEKTKKGLTNIIYGIPFAIASFLPMNNSYGQMIPKDKQYHMGAGFVIGAWGTLTSEEKYGWQKTRNGMIAVGIAGVGKETYDWVNPGIKNGLFKGTFDLKDLAADFIGGAISIGIIKLCTPKKGHHLMTYGPTSINPNEYAFRNSPVKNKNRLYD
jgi:hypothetical protein